MLSESQTNGITSHDLDGDKKLNARKKKKLKCLGSRPIFKLRSVQTLVVKHNLARKKKSRNKKEKRIPT